MSVETTPFRSGILHDNWPREACRVLERSQTAVVRVLIAATRGSSPREPGTNMLVLRDGALGTIGGGNLEWQALRYARTMLDRAVEMPPIQLIRMVLGPDLGQCCGGVVHLWLERLTPADLPRLLEIARRVASDRAATVATELSAGGVGRRMLEHGSGDWQRARAELHDDFSKVLDPGTPAAIQLGRGGGGHSILLERIEVHRAALWLYGAGHVGQALVRVLEGLPFDITWLDSRQELLPTPLSDNVRALHAPMPDSTVMLAPPHVRFLVMTHEHALDYALCREILRRDDFAWLGLIGSKSKGARFRSRLRREGTPPGLVARLVCPIGVQGVHSKSPAAIAVAVAAQLLQGLGSASVTAVESSPITAVALSGDCSPDCAGCRAPIT